METSQNIGEVLSSNITYTSYRKGSEKKEDSIKTAILLNFAGKDAIQVFNTFQFPKGNEKMLDKGLEQFERFEGSRDGVEVIALASHLRSLGST